MDFDKICRTCLSKNNLSPIFTNEKENILYFETIFSATGVKIEKNDGLPQNMCSNCSVSLQNTLDFRKKCKDAESKLISIKPDNDNNTKVQEHKPQNNYKKSINVLENETILTNNIDEFDQNNESSDDDKPLIFLTENTTDNSHTKPIKDILYNNNDNSTKITCKLCQKSLSRRSLTMHMVRHHPGVDESRVQCELCNDYILKENLSRHLMGIHGTDSFKCRFCKKEFNNKDLLVKHVNNCTVKKRRRDCKSARELTECDVCHKKMQKASLRAHKAIKHAGLGPVCEHCGKRFGNKFRLSEHYRAKHGYEKFKCNHCDFQSAGVMAMRNHERRHRGEKPFICETCGAKFHAAYLLAQHKQSHRTEKQFKCSLCPAAFKANNSLHMHRRACHSAARVACALCSRAYSCRHYALKHMRAVHRYTGPVPQLAQT